MHPAATDTTRGTVIRADRLDFHPEGPCQVACAVGPHLGARTIRLDVVRIPAGATWKRPSATAEENVAVVFQGTGQATSGRYRRPIAAADAVYAPTGDGCELTADRDAPLTAYVWTSRLLPGRPRATAPRRFTSLWDTTAQLTGFTGTGQAAPPARTATMNFLFWPGTGSPQLCLHCGVMQPGEYFSVHVHPHSEEAFIAFEGSGQLHLDGRWIDAEAGDVLYAPPGVPHGTRHPAQDAAAPRFVTCGGPTPFDPMLYERAGLSTEVI